MEFVSPFQNKKIAAPIHVRVTPLPNESFSSIFASGSHALSKFLSAFSDVMSAAKNIMDPPSRNAARDAKTYFSQTFPDLTVPAVARVDGQYKRGHVATTSNKTVPNMARMVNFNRPNLGAVRATALAGTTTNVGITTQAFSSVADRSHPQMNGHVTAWSHRRRERQDYRRRCNHERQNPNLIVPTARSKITP
ncbi:MAG: hypothetical protein ACLPN1_16850 [Dissulfurispiraceae bacterium]